MTGAVSDEFRQGWGLLLAAFFGLAFGVATISITYTIGIFVDPLREEFGWTRAEVYTVAGMVSVAVGVLSPAVGWLTDRVNVRPLLIFSQLGFGLMFFAMALGIQGRVTYLLLYFALAIVGAATIAVPFAKLITHEFVRNRGLALGIAMSGSGICGLMVPPYAAYVVEHFGWRAGYMAIGLLPLLLALPLTVAFVRDRRFESVPRTEQPAPQNADEDPSSTENFVSLKEALKGYRFWALFCVFTLGSCVMTALLTNLVPILSDRGYSRTVAATMTGSFGITVIAGRIVVGFLIDRIWAPLVGCAIFLPAAVGIALLAGLELGTAGLVGVILLTGFAAGAEVDLMGFLVARYFGLRDFGKLYAGIYVGFALGPGSVLPFFAAARDQFGTYQPGLYAAAIALAVAAALLVSLGRYPKGMEATH